MSDDTPDFLLRMQARELATPTITRNGWPGDDATTFCGISLTPMEISHQGESQSLEGVTAFVETIGQLSKRVTATRVVAGGVLFGPVGAIIGALVQKKKDDREMYLLVDGPRYAWSVPVDSGAGAEARSFAARVNTAGKRA